MLEHQAISTHNANEILIALDQFHVEILQSRATILIQ